jgi:hypothetical protein
LLRQISSYNIKSNNVKESEISKSSYFLGLEYVMKNLSILYDNTRKSAFGGAKITALNCTINYNVLKEFLIDVKNDLGIENSIFKGNKLDIPTAYNEVINVNIRKHIKPLEENNIIYESFILGVKRTAGILLTAYNAPATGPFKRFIENESKDIVKNIGIKLNSLIGE